MLTKECGSVVYGPAAAAVAAAGREAFVIGPANPYLGWRLRCTWLRPWGGHQAGHAEEGVLLCTFVKGGRTLIGLLLTEAGRVVSCPWSRNYLAVEPLGLASGALAEEARRVAQAKLGQYPESMGALLRALAGR